MILRTLALPSSAVSLLYIIHINLLTLAGSPAVSLTC